MPMFNEDVKYLAHIKATGEVLECPILATITKCLRKSCDLEIAHGQKIRTALIECGKYETKDVIIEVDRGPSYA